MDVLTWAWIGELVLATVSVRITILIKIIKQLTNSHPQSKQYA
jgi:hypothetical protein